MKRELAEIRSLLAARTQRGDSGGGAIGRAAEISLELMQAKSAPIEETVHS
jgi:hypothetical protein